MKKVLALFFTLVLLGGYAMAETFDFSGLSDEELLSLFDTTVQEIATRGIEKTAILTAGVYVAGVDLPIGSYHFESAGADSDRGIFYLQPKFDYADPNTAYSNPRRIHEVAEAESSPEYYITLEEGDTLSLPYQFKATICAGIKFE